MIKKTRGRPKKVINKHTTDKLMEATKVKPRRKIKELPEEKNNYKYDPNKEYAYWFIADECGCRLGADIFGSGMWCMHKNSMHLEERKLYASIYYWRAFVHERLKKMYYVQAESKETGICTYFIGYVRPIDNDSSISYAIDNRWSVSSKFVTLFATYALARRVADSFEKLDESLRFTVKEE